MISHSIKLLICFFKNFNADLKKFLISESALIIIMPNSFNYDQKCTQIMLSDSNIISYSHQIKFLDYEKKYRMYKK